MQLKTNKWDTYGVVMTKNKQIFSILNNKFFYKFFLIMITYLILNKGYHEKAAAHIFCFFIFQRFLK